MAVSKTGNKKILLKDNVFEAAKKRIAWIFDEFENVVVSHSGGKDSTIIFHLAMDEATRRGRLPLPVVFVDQEGEWQNTIDLIKSIMYRQDVKPLWYQFHFKINNAASYDKNYLEVWGPGEKWIREKDPISIKETPPGIVDWYDLFPAIMKSLYGSQPACFLGGMRTEESPNRQRALTIGETYKGVTWGKLLAANHYTFYPIYDWSYTDVWKAIHDNQWPYNPVYDFMYQYGIPIQEMRVSSLFHESSIRNMFFMQEIEPENYVRLTQRLSGMDMVGKLADSFYCPKELPPMFASWKEYRDYLLENLVTEVEHREFMRKRFAQIDVEHLWWAGDSLYRREINSILTNDFGLWKFSNITVPRHLYDKHKQMKNERRAARKAEKEKSNVSPGTS